MTTLLCILLICLKCKIGIHKRQGTKVKLLPRLNKYGELQKWLNSFKTKHLSKHL